MNRFLYTITFCFQFAMLFGQTNKIDSLKHLIYSAKNHVYELKATIALCDEFETLPKDTLWHYADKAIILASKINDTQNFSLAIIAKANAYLRWNNADSAKALIIPELSKYNVKDAATRNIYFKLEQARIDCIGDANNYKDALNEVYKVIREAERYKDSVVLAQSMNTICAWYYDMDFLAQGRAWGYKALSNTSNTPRFYPIRTVIYLNLCSHYNWIGKLDSASYCVSNAIRLSEHTQNLFLLSEAMQKLATIYIEKKEYRKAEQAILKSMQMSEKIDGKSPQQDKLIVLASVYEHSGQVNKAIDVLNNGILLDSFDKNHSPHGKKGEYDADLQRVFYYEELAKCYHIKGDSKNYDAALEKIIAGKDAFYKANSAAEIAELETKYNVQKKEATIAQQKLALIKENTLFYGSLLFLFFSGIIIWLIFTEFRKKQKFRLRLLRDEERRLALQAIADAEESERRRIAADLHDNLGAQLSFIKRNVNFIMDQPEGFSQGDEKKYLGYVNDIAQNAMIDLRETIWVLNKEAVNIEEFADKLKSYIRQQLLSKETVKLDFQEEIATDWKFSSGEVMHIFRIVQEVITNIIKHSGANQINVKLVSGQPNAYQLEIMDNGKGFDTGGKYEGHYGLENIQNRSKEIDASLLVESDPEMGTKITLIKGPNNTYGLYSKLADKFIFTK